MTLIPRRPGPRAGWPARCLGRLVTALACICGQPVQAREPAVPLSIPCCALAPLFPVGVAPAAGRKRPRAALASSRLSSDGLAAERPAAVDPTASGTTANAPVAPGFAPRHGDAGRFDPCARGVDPACTPGARWRRLVARWPALPRVLGAAALLAVLLGAVYWRAGNAARRSAAQLQARVAERERRARGLHDSLLQNVQGLVLRLHTALKSLPLESKARVTIESILDQADGVMEKARAELLDLRTGPGKAGQDLDHALARFGLSLQEQFGPRFELLVRGTPRPLHLFAWNALFLIAREALFNAYQHAEAGEIEVELVYGCRAFTLYVRDDGCGIVRKRPQGAGKAAQWGLAGMRERALGLEGSLDVWTRHRAGTELVLRVPARAVYAAPRPPSLRHRLLAVFSRLPR